MAFYLDDYTQYTVAPFSLPRGIINYRMEDEIEPRKENITSSSFPLVSLFISNDNKRTCVSLLLWRLKFRTLVIGHFVIVFRRRCGYYLFFSVAMKLWVQWLLSCNFHGWFHWFAFNSFLLRGSGSFLRGRKL